VSTIAAMRARSEQYQAYQRLFSMTVDDFSNLESLDKSCTKRHAVWKLLADLESSTHSWTTDAVSSLDMAVITAAVEHTQVGGVEHPHP
jgi:hypothetical protein